MVDTQSCMWFINWKMKFIRVLIFASPSTVSVGQQCCALTRSSQWTKGFPLNILSHLSYRWLSSSSCSCSLSLSLPLPSMPTYPPLLTGDIVAILPCDILSVTFSELSIFRYLHKINPCDLICNIKTITNVISMYKSLTKVDSFSLCIN